MKRIAFTIVLTCCTLVMAAQDAIRVNYSGTKPTITDFAWAYLFFDEENEEECDQEATADVENALMRYRQGLQQENGAKLIVDEKNGYILYEWYYDHTGSMKRVEMCYWNEADGKHKLFAYSSWYYENGKPGQGQYDCLTFYRYNNATKKMSMIETPGFDVEYLETTYTLPRVGKDIIVNKWKNGKKLQKTLKWKGRRFSLQ
ncbi:MAG: hypothetical protein K5893_06810 [Prevotella sp.]|nr:hypothetical protein [Prevotella sp.]